MAQIGMSSLPQNSPTPARPWLLWRLIRYRVYLFSLVVLTALFLKRYLELGRHKLERTFPFKLAICREAASMAFDPATGQLILFGGFDGANSVNDTWNWDGTTKRGVNCFPQSTLPPARAFATMAFDPATGQLILFGGIGNSGFLDDTWNWDGKAKTWTQLTTVQSPALAALLQWHLIRQWVN